MAEGEAVAPRTIGLVEGGPADADSLLDGAQRFLFEELRDGGCANGHEIGGGTQGLDAEALGLGRHTLRATVGARPPCLCSAGGTKEPSHVIKGGVVHADCLPWVDSRCPLLVDTDMPVAGAPRTVDMLVCVWRYTLRDLLPSDDPEAWALALAAEGWRLWPKGTGALVTVGDELGTAPSLRVGGQAVLRPDALDVHLAQGASPLRDALRRRPLADNHPLGQ